MPISGSSHKWILRQTKDPFVQAANTEGFRSRAAFKLLDLQKRFRIISKGDAIVDLGAAPGSWSQVAVQLSGSRLSSQKLQADTMNSVQQPLTKSGSRLSIFDIPAEEIDLQTPAQPAVTPSAGQPLLEPARPLRPSSRGGLVVSVDLLQMQPLNGAIFLQGDFTRPAIRERALAAIKQHRQVRGIGSHALPTGDLSGQDPTAGAGSIAAASRGGLADVLLSDMAHNFTGENHTDHLRQTQLSWTALLAAPLFLRRDGNTAIKVRYGQEYKPLLTAMQRRFRRVVEVKPPASRAESAEAFIVGLSWCGPAKALGQVTQEEVATLHNFGLAWPDT